MWGRKERRKDRRIPVTEAGFLVREDTNKLIPVRIFDVSFNGVGLVTEYDISGDEEFLLQYSIFHRSFSFPVKIAWFLINKSKVFLGCHKKPTE